MSKLFSEYKIKNLKLKNRIVMAPMCMYSSDTSGHVKPWHLIHYASRAVGGVGLIIIEATAVEPRGRISDGDLGIWSDDHIKGLKTLVEAVHAQGGKIGIQLAHAGSKCGVSSESLISSSSLQFSDRYQMPKVMDEKDIKAVVDAFGQGAKRALEAGFDMIEIHGAHGYLIHQFMSPLMNNRQDDYGLDQKKGTKFLKEVIGAVKAYWPEDKVLGIRVSAEDYKKGGHHPSDVAEQLLLLEDRSLDVVHVSSGGAHSQSIKTYPGYQMSLAEIIKFKTKLPTIGGGLITKAETAEAYLSNDSVDLIFLGRALLDDPYWPMHSKVALKEEVKWPEQYKVLEY